MDPPRVHYAKSGEVNIAYRISGEGPLSVLRGDHELKGVPGPWHIWAAES